MGVKSVITHPSGTMSMSGPGVYEISGLAWSGLGKIARVEVSTDEGNSWSDADLQKPVLDKAMTRFAIEWKWDGKPTTLLSRAHDEAGYVQPTRTAWKKRYAPSNYNHYNAIQAWRISSDGAVTNAHT
jgi:sulfane dehydrogenase subunit SoxC